MNTFQIHALEAFGVLFGVFWVGLLTVTLMLVDQIHNNDINQSMVTFVQAGNWILAGFLMLALLGLIVLSPSLYKFRKMNLRYHDFVDLEPAKTHPASI